MKTINKALILIMLAGLMSCSDSSEMLTVINKDGSCYREFTANADSAFMVGNKSDEHNPFPVEINSNWKIIWQHNDGEVQEEFPISTDKYNELKNSSINSIKLTVKIRRDYDSVNEMSRVFKLKPSHEWAKMDVKYEFKKSFRWFYTYYAYSETFPKIEHSFISLDEFMTKDEVQFWFTGKPDLLKGMNGIEIEDYISDMDGKYNKWLFKNYWNAMYDVLIENFDELNLSVAKADFIEARDSLFEKNFSKIENDGLLMAECLDNHFKTNKVTLFWKDENGLTKDADDFLLGQDFVRPFEQSFTYKLIIPGEILEAENAIVQNNAFSWRLTAYRMIYDDYTIEAKSRIINYWAFIITGLIVLISIFSLFYKPKK
jgi:hypothetical protein